MNKSFFDDLGDFIDTHAEIADDFTNTRLSLCEHTLTKARDENKGSSKTFKQEIVAVANGVVHVRSARGRRYSLENTKYCDNNMVKVGDNAIVKRVVSNTPPHIAFYLMDVEKARDEKVLDLEEAEKQLMELGGNY